MECFQRFKLYQSSKKAGRLVHQKYHSIWGKLWGCSFLWCFFLYCSRTFRKGPPKMPRYGRWSLTRVEPQRVFPDDKSDICSRRINSIQFLSYNGSITILLLIFCFIFWLSCVEYTTNIRIRACVKWSLTGVSSKKWSRSLTKGGRLLWRFIADKITRWKNEKSRISWFASSVRF